MASFNKVILMGNLTRDPELKYLPSNTAVCDFGMAINRRWRDRDGNTRDDVCYVDVSAFGKQAEVINQYVGKGRPLLIEGHLKFDSWTAQDGSKRSKLSVVVDNFQFVGGREGGGAPGAERGVEGPRAEGRAARGPASAAGRTGAAAGATYRDEPPADVGREEPGYPDDGGMEPPSGERIPF